MDTSADYLELPWVAVERLKKKHERLDRKSCSPAAHYVLLEGGCQPVAAGELKGLFRDMTTIISVNM